MMNKLSMDQLDVAGRRVFVRVDFNVPLDEFGHITDDTRIRGALGTINALIDRGARIILASHLGRPEGERNPKYSLKQVVERTARLLSREVRFVDDCIGPVAEKAVAELKNGDILLLENLRFYKEEEENDEAFSKKLAALADLYVNDAFGTAHRAHASTHGVTKFVQKAAAGYLMKKEIEYFNRSVANPIRPVVAIVGGAKASTKIKVFMNLIDHVDKIIVGGGLAFTFYKAMGYNVGKCKVEEKMMQAVLDIKQKARDKGVKFYLPVDFVVADRLDPRANTKVVPAKEIPDDWLAPDIGPASVTLFSEVLHDAKTIIWNGPMGVFEMDQFSRGTMAMVRAVANAYALTIAGGGDTDVAIHKAGESDKFSFISTGGGAFLELLEGKALPAIEALSPAP